MRLLLVDDDPEVLSVLRRALVSEGHTVHEASSIATAKASLASFSPDVIVLDLGLPDGSGIELCRMLRRTSDAPVLMLTARSDVARRVEALDAGADDFLAKPFAIAELRARVRALGRRRRGAVVPNALMFGEVRLDFAARVASQSGAALAVTSREWAILEALASRKGRVMGRSELLEEIWGQASDAAAASLEVLIGRVRRKLGEGVIRTVRGEGYALGNEVNPGNPKQEL